MMLSQEMMSDSRIDPSNQPGAASATIGVATWTTTTAVPRSAITARNDRLLRRRIICRNLARRATHNFGRPLARRLQRSRMPECGIREVPTHEPSRWALPNCRHSHGVRDHSASELA